MYDAAVKAREGDVQYFQNMPAAELNSLLVGRDEDGRTLLHTAAAQGHLKLLQLLIDAGAAKVASKHDDEVRRFLQCNLQGCYHCCTPGCVMLRLIHVS